MVNKGGCKIGRVGNKPNGGCKIGKSNKSIVSRLSKGKENKAPTKKSTMTTMRNTIKTKAPVKKRKVGNASVGSKINLGGCKTGRVGERPNGGCKVGKRTGGKSVAKPRPTQRTARRTAPAQRPPVAETMLQRKYGGIPQRFSPGGSGSKSMSSVMAGQKKGVKKIKVNMKGGGIRRIEYDLNVPSNSPLRIVSDSVENIIASGPLRNKIFGGQVPMYGNMGKGIDLSKMKKPPMPGKKEVKFVKKKKATLRKRGPIPGKKALDDADMDKLYAPVRARGRKAKVKAKMEKAGLFRGSKKLMNPGNKKLLKTKK